MNHESQQIKLESRTVNGSLIVTVQNEQLHGDRMATLLRRKFVEILATNAAKLNVVLDLGRVTSLSSEAFRPLLSLRRKTEEKGGKLVLCNLSANVEQAFQATRMISSQRSSASAFDVEADVGAALAFLGGKQER